MFKLLNNRLLLKKDFYEFEMEEGVNFWDYLNKFNEID